MKEQYTWELNLFVALKRFAIVTPLVYIGISIWGWFI